MKKNINKKEQFDKGEIIIYETSKKEVDLKVRFENETIWLNQTQIVRLFDKDQSVISRHIKNIFKDGEVDKKSNMQNMHIANSDKPVTFYSLDIILAVGYRTNSKSAIKFRKWATEILKKYLTEGYVVNEQKLSEAQNKFIELQNTVNFLSEKSEKRTFKGQEGEILNLLKNYSKSLTFLEQYDKNNFTDLRGKKAKFILGYKEAIKVVNKVKTELIKKNEATELFGQERENTFAGIIGNIYQTFAGNELYLSIESKASHLLYFIIKDHPFSDGNKRNASFLFVYFLSKNKYLFKKNGERKINDNALVAIALLVAESKPKEKEMMIKLIINLIK